MMLLNTILNFFLLQQLLVGMPAPNFESIDQNKKKIALKDLQGKKIVLYFYPKDNTPGCTAQACNLRDNMNALIENGMIVIGVSTDGLQSHQKFGKEFKLPFSIITDSDKKISKDYNVYMPVFGMSKRTTFLINEKGIIDHIISSPNTSKHAEEIITLWK